MNNPDHLCLESDLSHISLVTIVLLLSVYTEYDLTKCLGTFQTFNLPSILFCIETTL